MRYRTITLIMSIIISSLLTGCKTVNLPINKNGMISYNDTEAILNRVSSNPIITVSKACETSTGRSVFLVNLNRGISNSQVKVLLVGMQHGNEVSGKDALVNLIADISENPEMLNPLVDLYIIPALNPDGGENNQRRNANNTDLNRDHRLLSQIETQTLYSIVNNIKPDIAVDCHEFGRNSGDYDNLGFIEWPDITMDITNNPVFSTEIYNAGLEWINNQTGQMKQYGFNFTRYMVGGPPPEEMRPSTTDVDDARNGIGSYGAVSLIIEAGRIDDPELAEGDIDRRIAAYRTLFDLLLNDNPFLIKCKDLAQKLRTAEIPDYIPVNYFWGDTDNSVQTVMVLDFDKNEIAIETPNVMDTLIIKNSVTRPAGYIIVSEAASVFKPFLEAHNIFFEVLDSPRDFIVEICSIDEIETEFDQVNNRYAGRHIVDMGEKESYTAQSGSIFVPITSGVDCLRAIVHLEPNMVYGLYNNDVFSGLLGDYNQIPVMRVVE